MDIPIPVEEVLETEQPQIIVEEEEEKKETPEEPPVEEEKKEESTINYSPLLKMKPMKPLMVLEFKKFEGVAEVEERND